MRSPDPDPLLMRKSTVNTLFVRGDLEPYRGVEMRSRNQLVVNRQHAEQFEDGTDQESGTVLRWTLSNRIGYTRPVGDELTLRVRGKHMLRWDRGYGNDPEQRFSIVVPTADARYQLTKHARLVVGQEGWPLLPFRFIDHENGDNNYTQRTTLAMGQVDWMYWGWSMTMSMGMQWQSRDSDTGDRGERTFFLESFVGF